MVTLRTFGGVSLFFLSAVFFVFGFFRKKNLSSRKERKSRGATWSKGAGLSFLNFNLDRRLSPVLLSFFGLWFAYPVRLKSESVFVSPPGLALLAS